MQPSTDINNKIWDFLSKIDIARSYYVALKQGQGHNN